MNNPLNDLELPRGIRSNRRTFFLLVIVLVFGALGVSLIFLPFVLASSDTGEETPTAGVVPRDITVDTQLPERLAETVRASAEKTVVIRPPLNSRDSEWSLGSGFLVRDGIAVTAAHVLAGRTHRLPVYVYCAGVRAQGVVLTEDALRDVSVIRVDGCHADVARFDEHPLLIEDKLHVAGFIFIREENKPFGAAHRFYGTTSPIPSAVLDAKTAEREFFEGVQLADHILQMQALGIPRFQAIAGAAIPGQSGSPVFKSDGTIVGMLVIRDPKRNRSYIVPATSLIAVMHAAGIK